MKSIQLILLSISLAICSSQKQVAAQESTTRLNFCDISGAELLIPCDPTVKGTVLVFINTQCPIANAYHPTLRKLKDEFAGANFDMIMIHADPEVTIDAARKHQLEYAITWPIALDPGNKIARRVSAKVTPEAVIIDSHGQTLYRGRIDDLHEAYGRKRPAPTTHDLRDAITSILNNRPIAHPETKAIGCIIRYAD